MNTTTMQKHSWNRALPFWMPAALAGLLVMSGCATNVIAPDDTRAPDIRFDPIYGSHEFQPRPAPAAITQDEDAALVRRGYYKLGTIKVDVNQHDRERLRDIFLSEAAAHGGDVVRPTIEAAAFREEDKVVGETMGGASPAYTPGRLSSLANGVDVDPHAKPLEWAETPGGLPQAVYQKGAKRFRSEGTVWRHDPPKADLKFTVGDSSQAVKKN